MVVATVFNVLAVILANTGEATLDWHIRVPCRAGHNAFTDLISWKGSYYLCFRHGSSHGSMDGAIHVMRSDNLRNWTPCGVLDTWGDDRDPHFVSTDDALYVYFGTWDLTHVAGDGLPDRHLVRSYVSSTRDGSSWASIKGVYEPGWWLWRVRRYDGIFYSAAYTAFRPRPSFRETRLTASGDGLVWTAVATVTKERMAGEADFLIDGDGNVRMLSRTGDEEGGAMWITGNINTGNWQTRNLKTVVHSPVLLEVDNRLFVAGRGRDEKAAVTRIWEWDGEALRTLITLPSGGDNAYPGLVYDPVSAPGAPAVYISWYSQHENEPGKKDPAAAVYVGRVVLPAN